MSIASAIMALRAFSPALANLLWAAIDIAKTGLGTRGQNSPNEWVSFWLMELGGSLNIL
jgi:hypothetical protein